MSSTFSPGIKFRRGACRRTGLAGARSAAGGALRGAGARAARATRADAIITGAAGAVRLPKYVPRRVVATSAATVW